MKKIIKEIIKYNSSRYRLFLEIRDFAQSIPEGSRVLDAGSGDSPYQDLFIHTKYDSTDFIKVDKNYTDPTFVCDLSNIPISDSYYNFIIFTQVMEHVIEPKKVLYELSRVLKPGGKLFYTGPLFYKEHEIPYDYYRYTQFGLRYLFENAGFVVERLDWLEGYFGTLGYQFDRESRDLPWKPSQYPNKVIGLVLSPLFILIKIIAKINSILFHSLEKLIKYQNSGYPKNYLSILIKPGDNKNGGL